MTTTRADLDSAAAVLELARTSRAAADRAEADVLLAGHLGRAAPTGVHPRGCDLVDPGC